MSDQPTSSYSVDPEHGNLRLAVAGIFIAATVLLYLVLTVVIPAEAVNLLAIIGALVLASVLTSLFERELKKRWPSGREIVLNGKRISLRRGSNVQHEMNLNGETQLLQWYFKIKRRARVPKGWMMVALAVHHMPDDLYMPIYTLMSPEAFDTLNAEKSFTELRPADEADKANMRLAGQQRRLHTAENARWQDGAEMTNEDFIDFVDKLEAHFHA